MKLHGALSRVKELANLSTDALEQKAFLLAMDIALSSGEIDEGEQAVLARSRCPGCTAVSPRRRLPTAC